VRLLLDTVTFLWSAAFPELLSRKALAALSDERAVREMSSISLSELAIKLAIGKLNFRLEDALAAIGDLRLRILPYTADHAIALFRLPLHHGDPFDRQIIAQAVSENIPIVTADQKFKLYKGLRVIW